MVKIEIDDNVWSLFKKSLALMDVRGDDQLVRFLEMELTENSISVIEDAEKQLLDDTPEAYVQREMGREKERRKKINK